MSEKKYGLLDVLQHADEQMIYEAGQPWENRRKNLAGRAGMRVAGLLLVLAVGLMGIFHEQVEAAISEITSLLAAHWGNSRDLSSYAKSIHQTQTNNGIRMTIEEVVMDTNRIRVCAEVSVEPDSSVKAENLENFENLWAAIGSVWIDGEYLDGIVLTGSYIWTEDEYTDERMSAGTDAAGSGRVYLEYSFEEGAVSDDMSEVELMIWLKQKEEDGSFDAAGEFRFSFEATKEQLQAESHTIPLDVDIDAGSGLTLHPKELRYTDLGGRITVNCSSDPRIWHSEGYEEGTFRYYDIPYLLEITDSQGNSSWFWPAGSYYEEDDWKELLFDYQGGTPPAEDAEYLEIRLYRAETVWVSGTEDGAGESETEGNLADPEEIANVRVDLK